MRLKTAAWNTAAFDTAALEHGFIDASIIHGFNDCAKVLIRISDPTGEKLRKYDSDAVGNEIYVGSGKVLLYKDTGTCIFNGRILSSERTGKVLTLTCEDWMNQLKDERIHYDFREDLNGSGLRASGAHGNLDAGTPDYRAPAYTNGANYYLIDDDMAWAIDQWNGYRLVLLNENFGSVTVRVGPYTHSILSGGMTFNGWLSAWEDGGGSDGFNADVVACNGYHSFHLQATEGSLFDSIESASLNLSIGAIDIDVTNGVYVYLHQWTAPSNELLRYIKLADGDTERVSIPIPNHLLADMVDTDGAVQIKYYAEDSAASPDIYINQAQLEVKIKTTGVATSYEITDTLRDPDDGGATYNTLKNTTIDLSVTGLGIWEEFKYSMVQELYNRINEIVTGGDPLVTLTTSIESTSGLTTWHAADKTRFEILQYIAPIDNSVFWVPLGTTEVNWKNTTDATATTLEDRNVLRWIKTKYDMTPFMNQAVVYGVRIDNDEVKVTTDDATTQADYDFVRTEVIKDSGISSDFEASSFGTALLSQKAKIPLSVTAELVGFSDIRLGDYITVTSDLLDLSAAAYTVDRWEYSNNTTKVRLQPRTTDGYIIFREWTDTIHDQRTQILENRLARDLEQPTIDTWVNP